MIRIDRAVRSDDMMKSLTGPSCSEFGDLVPTFAAILLEKALSKERERAPGGGSYHTLGDSKGKLFFILFYVKCYPILDLAAFFFGVDKSRISRWVDEFLPVLEETLGRKAVLPERKIRTRKEFRKLFRKVGEVFIDGTERPVRRSKNPERQREEYSGKKKRHTRKHIVVTDSKRRILVLSRSEAGKTHDYKAFGNSGIGRSLPKGTVANVDLAFTGMKKDYPHLDVRIPHKKPKGGELTPEQKAENKALSSRRVLVEHAISGVKRMKSLTDIHRNRRDGMDDILMNVGCGLWNFHLKKA